MATLLRGDHPAPTPKTLAVIFARDFRGREPAWEWLESLDEIKRKRMAQAIHYVEQVGSSAMRERLVSLSFLGSIARGLSVIRADRFLRLIGTFKPGPTFLALWGVDKRRDDFERGDIMHAQRVRREYEMAAGGSLDFVHRQTPKPSPTFRPSIVVPDTARPDPTPPSEPVRLFRPTENEWVWAWVEKRDLMPPHAPLLKSLCRFPTYHHTMVQEEVPAYIAERLRAMNITERLAMGLIDDNTTVLQLGALWAIELMTARTLETAAAAKPTTPQLEPKPMPTSDSAKEEPSIKLSLFWVHANPENGHGRKRFLFEVLGPAVTRRGTGATKVRARRYKAASGSWSNVLVKPASMFVNVASLTDPLVVEAISRRP
jgi:hypothetical protein